MPTPNADHKDPSLEMMPDKAKDIRVPPASSSKDEKSGGDVNAIIAQVMKGEVSVDVALGLVPGLIPLLQKTFGNDALQKLLGTESKEGTAKTPAEPKAPVSNGDAAADKGAGPSKLAMAGAAIGAGVGAAFGATAGGPAGKLGGLAVGGVGGFVAGSFAGKMLDRVKGKAAEQADKTKAGQEDDAADEKGAESKKAAADESKTKVEVVKGQDPGAKVAEAIKETQGKDPGPADATKDTKDAGKQAAEATKKSDDALTQSIADKSELKGGGEATASASAVQSAAADVVANKDEVKSEAGAGKDADAGKEAGGAKTGPVAGKVGGETGVKTGAGDAAATKDGADKKDGATADKGKKTDGKEAAEGKDGDFKGDPAADKAEDDKAAKDSPIAQDAQKAKEKADAGGGGEAGKVDDGKEAKGSDEKSGGGGGKEAKAIDVAGGDGGGGADAGGDGGGGSAPAAPTVKGTLDEYIKANPDTAAQKRVDDLGFANDKVGRDANVLKSNITPAPDKHWTDAISPRQEWFAFKKGVLGPNKWTGQDAALDFMTRLNAALDSIGGAASKIGLAATIGGAILTLLVPPVGAFLLSVGRVCNAISLVCSAMRIVTSIVSTIMLAVKAAKEKDPIKRLEMMQEMKQNVQAGVMAGLDVIMSKLGGKGGGGASKGVAGKSLEAAKAAFKDGWKAGGVKGLVKGSVGFVKEGAKAAFQGMKQVGKDAVASVKGQLSSMKQLGLKGTLKVAGQGMVNTAKSMGSGLKDLAKEKFVTPFTDLRSAWKSCGNFRQNWSDFRSMISANGGGFSGYTKTIGQINFPNFAKGGNWKEKASSVFSDMTNTSKGGYASQVMAGMQGKDSKHHYEKHADGTDILDHRGNKVLDTEKYKKDGVFSGAGATSAGGVFGAEQMAKLEKLKKLREGGSEMEKRKELNGGKITEGGLNEAANKQTEMTGADGLKQRHKNYKDNLGGQYGGDAYSFVGADGQRVTKSNLDWHLDQKITKMEDSFKMVNPQWGSMAWGAGTGAYAVSQGKGEWSDVARGAVSGTGTLGAWGTKTFGGDDSEKKQAAGKASKEKWGDWDQLKYGGGYNGGASTVFGTAMNTASAAGKKGISEAGKKADANREAAVAAYGASFQAKSGVGVTAGKVNAATAPALALVQARAAAIQSSIGAGAGAGAGASLGAVTGASAVGAVAGEAATEQKQPPPPPPPAPPEGTTVPSMELLPQIAAERKKIDALKAGVQADIKASEEMKTQAIGADAQMQKYATGLDQQATEIGQQKADAVKDAADISKAKQDISAGGKKVGEKKTSAEGEKSKSEATASEGKGVSNPQVDNAKKKAEEDKKAAQEKAVWDREYNSANWAKKRWMDAKKFIGGIVSWVAKAAKWVWEKVIKVAIEAVKKAVAKVLGFITDLMMKGILSLVKCFLSKEEGARLDETMAKMKELEAEQAKKGAEEAGSKNQEAKMKLTDAQQAAKAKIDHAQKNIETGNQLLSQADANKAALDQEEADIKAKNDAFRAQYTPYFDWVAKYEAEQSGGEGAGAAAGAALGAAAAGAAKAKEGGESDAGGAENAGAVVKGAPVNEGAKDGAQKEHPADQKVDAAIAVALANAVGVVILESRTSQSEVAKAASSKEAKVSSIAGRVGNENVVLIQAAAKGGDQGKAGELIAEEKQKTAASEKASGNVTGGVVGSHAKAEADRQARLQALQAKAAGLSQLALTEGLAAAQALAKELAREAKSIDDAKNEAMFELDKGFKQALGA